MMIAAIEPSKEAIEVVGIELPDNSALPMSKTNLQNHVTSHLKLKYFATRFCVLMVFCLLFLSLMIVKGTIQSNIE